MGVDGAPRMQSTRVPRTVSPPSAHVKRFAMLRGANEPVAAVEHDSKRLINRASLIHHKDRNEKNKKMRRKTSTDYGELHAQKFPPNKKNEFENIHSTLTNKIQKPDGVSTPKFIKSREGVKKKGAKSGTTKRKMADRRYAVPYKESQTTVLPDSIEQQEFKYNKQRWPAMDSIKLRRPARSTNHTERQQIVTSPEHTERQKPATSPDNTITLYDDTKRRKPTGSAHQTDLGKPVTSPNHAERRKPATSPDHAEHRQPTSSPESTKQRLATTKDDERRRRHLVVRGDSRAAAVAEAVAKCSSNSAYPAWLRRH